MMLILGVEAAYRQFSRFDIYEHNELEMELLFQKNVSHQNGYVDAKIPTQSDLSHAKPSFTNTVGRTMIGHD